jgi:hypothetical protein
MKGACFMACKFCNVHGDLGEDHDYIWEDKFDFGMLAVELAMSDEVM